MSDVEVAWADAAAEAWPPRTPDLYLGEPLIVAARLASPGRSKSLACVTTCRGRRAWAPTERRGAGVAKLWARRKIAALTDSVLEGGDAGEVRRGIVEVALAHHLVSQHTSLVAVDVTPTAPAGIVPKTRALPVNLPAGWSAEHVFGELPQGATPARLLAAVAAVLGVAAVALVWLARRRARAGAVAR